jgi:hypothetical protein
LSRACLIRQTPFRPDSALKDHVRPAAIKAGITNSIGWHTSRHFLARLLGQQGEVLNVIQKLLRHASSRIKSDVYRRGAQRGEAVCAEPGLGALRGQCQGVIEVQIEVQLFLSQPQTKKGSRSREPFFQNLSIPICLKMVYFFNRPLLDLRVTCQIEPKSFEIWRGQRDSNSQPLP